MVVVIRCVINFDYSKPSWLLVSENNLILVLQYTRDD